MFWDESHADCSFFVDACPTGIGIWVPSLNRAWSQSLQFPPRHIYWSEALAVVQAALLAITFKFHRIIIYSDSLLCCQVFSRHSPSDIVRPLFRFLIPLLLSSNLDVKVLHVPGVLNSTADSLSRSNLRFFYSVLPSASVSPILIDPSIINGGIV